MLASRLRELREAHVVELGDDGYALTPQGRELLVALAPVAAWAARWARRRESQR